MVDAVDKPRTEADYQADLDKAQRVLDSLTHEHAWLVDDELPRLIEEHAVMLGEVGRANSAVAREFERLREEGQPPPVVMADDIRFRVNAPTLARLVAEHARLRQRADEQNQLILVKQKRRDEVGWVIPVARGAVETATQQLEGHRRHLEGILQAELGAARRQGRAGFLERLTGRAQP